MSFPVEPPRRESAPLPPNFEVLLPAAAIREAVQALAAQIAPGLGDDAIAVCLLTGGLWFASDLMRALAVHDCNPLFDALWLASYGDARESRGAVEVRAGLQRPIEGRDVLILDDVIDSGLSLAEACRLTLQAGARSVATAVFARKPWTGDRCREPDFFAWDAPDRFLVGYGMDWGGRYRGLPDIAAVD